MWAALGEGDNGFWVSVSAGEVAKVHLEQRSRTRGYCIVVWRHGHVAEPGDLDRFRRAGTGLRSSRRDGRSRHAWEAIFTADPVPEAELHRQAADLRGLLDT